MTDLSSFDVQPLLAANRRYWTGWSPGSDPDADLPVYRSGLTDPLLNGVLRVRNRPLAEALAEARTRLVGSPWLWWVGADSDEGTAESLLDRGAQQVGAPPVMAIDVTELPTVPGFAPAEGLQIRAAGTPEALDSYVRTYLEPLGVDIGQAPAALAGELGFAFPDVVRIAGTVGGKTVATCTLSLGTEVAALYCITTVPRWRGNGFATALTLHALALAREAGRSVVTLVSTEAGEPVYRRIGFRPVTHYGLYMFHI